MKTTVTDNGAKDDEDYYTIVHNHCTGVLWKQCLFDVAPYVDHGRHKSVQWISVGHFRFK